MLESDPALFPATYLRDGNWLVYRGMGDVWVLPLHGDAEPRPLLQTEFNEGHSALSPDVRYLAYTSDESGCGEVYVTPFPEIGRKWQDSRDGGDRPI